jgi:serine/threonine protein kinase
MITSEYQALSSLCLYYPLAIPCLFASLLACLMDESIWLLTHIAWYYQYAQRFRLIYRDIKQENIAFDCRGDVKVFDMGLCRSLNPALRSKDRDGRVAYGYLLTPRTGSVPYMAPEVVECKPYDDKCDVFSFSILLWEIMSLKPAFKGYSRREFLERVVRGGERHTINRRWPPLTRTMIKEAWDHDPEKRPDMKRLAVMIRGDLNAKTSDPAVQQRSIHMRERSEASFRLSREQSDDSFRLSRTAALSLSTSSRNVPVSFHARNSAASIAASSVSSSGLQ